MKAQRLQAGTVALALGLWACFPLSQGEPQPLAGKQVRLTLLHTSDIHSRILPYDFSPLKTDVDLGLIPEMGPFGGATRVASILKRERRSADRVLHLDSGDSFQGAPIFNVNQGEVELRFLSNLGLDAACIGNHEFDFGALNFTQQTKNHANFPMLAANYAWEDPSQPGSNQTVLYSQPYTIKDVKGLKVGIIGLGNISSLNSLVEGGNSLQATPLEQNEAVRGYVELLKPVTDLILVVSHAGLIEDQELVEGYEAFYEYGRIKHFLNRSYQQWDIQEWFGPEGADASVVRVHIPGVIGIDAILGGHLHVVLNPPQVLTDPSGRKVILSHGGAFAKYVNRLDLVVDVPEVDETGERAEVVSHEFKVFPVDGLWCSSAMHSFYKSKFWNPGEFVADPQVQAALAECKQGEDPDTTQLLQPYIVNLDFAVSLASVFAYAPRDIARRNSSSGGDAPLGNMAADAMRKRRRVEAELAVTNALGIRDNLYTGVLSQESMFNVFPFENTINIMYLSGGELQEMFDFITSRSAGRGCISQAQISGARFTMDCAQSQLNDLRLACNPSGQGEECPQEGREGRAPWQCLADTSGGRCWAHAGIDIVINGQPLDQNTTYRVAVNDYIAKGGSGFAVLKRNTTRIETGIPLRDSLIGYMQDFCTCDDVLAEQRDEQGNILGKKGQLCGALVQGKWTIDPLEVSYCQLARDFQTHLTAPRSDGPTCQSVFRAGSDAAAIAQCVADLRSDGQGRGGPNLGACQCVDALSGSPLCGHVTAQVKAFCENPTALAVAVGYEDGRIARRVK